MGYQVDAEALLFHRPDDGADLLNDCGASRNVHAICRLKAWRVSSIERAIGVEAVGGMNRRNLNVGLLDPILAGATERSAQ
jgi:hypothetical protein